MDVGSFSKECWSTEEISFKGTNVPFLRMGYRWFQVGVTVLRLRDPSWLLGNSVNTSMFLGIGSHTFYVRTNVGELEITRNRLCLFTEVPENHGERSI